MNAQQKKLSVVNRLAPPVALWLMNRLLTQPDVMDASARLDRKIHRKQRRAAGALRRAGRNATANRGLLTAGLATITVGLGLLARAASRR